MQGNFLVLHTRVRERVRGALVRITAQSERTRQFQATTRSARAKWVRAKVNTSPPDVQIRTLKNGSNFGTPPPQSRSEARALRRRASKLLCSREGFEDGEHIAPSPPWRARARCESCTDPVRIESLHYLTGIVKENVLPFPSTEETPSFPPCPSTILFTIKRPRPEPFANSSTARCALKNFSNKCF